MNSLPYWLCLLGFAFGLSSPVQAQPAPHTPTAKAEVLTELDALAREVKQLYEEGLFEKAIPLAEKALAITEESFTADSPKSWTLWILS